MLDINTLRADVQVVAQRLADRGYTLDTAQFAALEAERKTIQTETQELQAKRNALSKQIGQLKAKKEDASRLMAEVNAQAEQLKSLEVRLEDVQQRLNDFLMVIPNVPHASVPAGKSADDNLEVRRIGDPRKFEFAVLDHVDVGAALGGLALCRTCDGGGVVCGKLGFSDPGGCAVRPDVSGPPGSGLALCVDRHDHFGSGRHLWLDDRALRV